MRGLLNKRVLVACLSIGLLACATAVAQPFSTGFEDPPYLGSAAGTVLTGQDGWYLPAGVDSMVYTYAGNALGVSPNPTGGDQFAAGTGPGSPDFARAQRDLTWGTGTWTVAYDMAGLYDGPAPGANNIGSFSLQPSATCAGYIHLFSWVDTADPVDFNAFYMAYDAGGTQFAQPGASPGPEWEALDLNHWYRHSTIIDFDINMITEVSITDLTTGVSATYNPTDWYLGGGTTPADPPTGFRFFAGGGVAGNSVAWDNLGVVPEPATLSALLLAGLALLRRR